MLHRKLSSSAPWRDSSSAARGVTCSKQSRNRINRTFIIPSAAAVASDAEAQVSAVVHPVHPVLPAPSEAHFENDNTVFVEEFRIRGNEAGPDQKANIITIANLLQEIGGNHGVAMWGRSSTGFASMPGMDHLIFVATRMQIRMEAYPMWGDTVRLETYFAEDGRLTTRRDWRLTDAKTGRYLGAATSTWVTINTETRRPAKIPEDVKQRFRTLAPAPPRFAIAKEDARKKLPDFVWPPQLTAPSQLGRRSDMDPNGHINNVAYLAWALEVIPEHTYQNYQLSEVEMDFKAECTAGDQIECFGQPLTQAVEGNGTKQQFLHLLRKGGTDTEVWRARTTWVPVSSISSNGTSKSASAAANGAAASNGAVKVSVPANGRSSSSSSSSATVAAPVPVNGHSSSSVSANGAGSGVSTASANGVSSNGNGTHAAAAPSSTGSKPEAAADNSSNVKKGGLVVAALGALWTLFTLASGGEDDSTTS